MARASRTRLAAEAWGSVLRAHAALVPVMDRRLQDAVGLPLSWYDVLLELEAAPESRLTMSQLSDRVVLSRTRVSRLVDELVAAGLVERVGNSADRRSAFAVLTGPGEDRFRQAAPVYRDAITAEFAQHLTDEELLVLRDALGRLAGASGGG